MYDIKDDNDLVKVIDELKFRLKSAIPFKADCNSMCCDFNDLLNDFIYKHKLGNDIHNFATTSSVTKEIWNQQIALVMDAFLHKKTLQYKDTDGEWKDSDIHTIKEAALFINYGAIYRVKPEEILVLKHEIDALKHLRQDPTFRFAPDLRDSLLEKGLIREGYDPITLYQLTSKGERYLS